MILRNRPSTKSVYQWNLSFSSQMLENFLPIYNCTQDFILLYDSFIWIGFICLKAAEPLREDTLLFTTKSPGLLGTHLIDLGRIKGWVNHGATRSTCTFCVKILVRTIKQPRNLWHKNMEVVYNLSPFPAASNIFPKATSWVNCSDISQVCLFKFSKISEKKSFIFWIVNAWVINLTFNAWW